MMQIRPAQERGGADHGWLNTKHTFSFADYYHPEHMGFSALRVINEDRIQAGTGFPTHGHRDMEIITIVLEGGIEHRDSTGTHAVVKPGEVQRMSAGTGVRHSEFNAYPDRETHFYQIWIMPDKGGLTPGYEQKSFTESLQKSDWVLAVSNDGRDGSLKMNQDARLWLAKIDAGRKTRRDLDPRRSYWVQVTEGSVEIEGQKFQAGDGAGFTNMDSIELSAKDGGNLLFFDLP